MLASGIISSGSVSLPGMEIIMPCTFMKGWEVTRWEISKGGPRHGPHSVSERGYLIIKGDEDSRDIEGHGADIPAD